jgi:DNA-binding Xre family transcriptional regulator
MKVSYNRLWKLLIDKNMMKICAELDCDFGDIVHYQKDEVKK